MTAYGVGESYHGIKILFKAYRIFNGRFIFYVLLFLKHFSSENKKKINNHSNHASV